MDERTAADAVTIIGLRDELRTITADRDRLRKRVLDLELQSGDRERHLRDALKDVRAERDRLRAVVDALNEEHAALWRVVNALRLHEQTVAANQDGGEQAIADRWQAVEQALDALDGSEATDG